MKDRINARREISRMLMISSKIEFEVVNICKKKDGSATNAENGRESDSADTFNNHKRSFSLVPISIIIGNDSIMSFYNTSSKPITGSSKKKFV